jgi:hypothetical protein
MVKLTLKKNAFEIENIDEFMKIIIAEDQKQQEYYAKILLPTNHVPLQRVLRARFQADFNQAQRANVDHDLQAIGYEAWNVCRDANYQVKRAMLDWFNGLDKGNILTNVMILSMIITTAVLFGVLIGRGL